MILACLLPIVFRQMSLSASAEMIRVPQDARTIGEALQKAGEGDTVLVSAGTYRERLRLPPGAVLRSAGDDTPGKLGLQRAESTIIDGGGAEGEGPGVLLAEGATLDGFTVTRVGVYDDALWQKHHATQGNEQSHEHIGHFGAPAVGIIGVSGTVTHCIVHHNGDTGIGIRGVEKQICAPRIAHNICYRNMGGGIGSMNGSTAIIDSNTCFQNFYAGIGHDDASPTVIRNRYYENIRAGIGISHGASPVVRGNHCYRNRRAGIGVRTGGNTRPIIDDNDCYENDMAGIGCEDEAAPIIRGNRCDRNKEAGIGSRSGARALIVGNTCSGNGRAGIGSENAARVVIIDNQSRENQAAGIGIEGTGNSAVICGNRCLENRLVALGLPDGATAVVADNHFERTAGQPPLVAVRGGASALFWRNSFTGGGVAALLVQGTATVFDSRFQGRGAGQGSAVWVWKDSNVSVLTSSFAGYRDAVNASGSRIQVLDNDIHGFQQTAIRVASDTVPAIITGNRAHSADPAATVVTSTGVETISSDNQVVPLTE